MITKDMLIIDALKEGDPDKIATVLQESGRFAGGKAQRRTVRDYAGQGHQGDLRAS